MTTPPKTDTRRLAQLPALVASIGILSAPALAEQGGSDLSRGDAPGNSRQFVTSYPPQMMSVAGSGWSITPLVTVGEPVLGYLAPGRLDGIAAFSTGFQTVRVYVNSEIRDWQGYPYTLGNGSMLTGARVSYFDVDKSTRAVTGAGLGYSVIRARNGAVVTDGIDGIALDTPGLGRLCSARGVVAGTFGFTDDIMFTGEEVPGGTEYALNVSTGELWALPALGRAAFENVATVTPPPGKVAMLATDDRSGAPLFLFIGDKKTGNYRDRIDLSPSRLSKHFLERNGLASGTLYTWVADDSQVRNSNDFSGTGVSEPGTFVPIAIYRPELAGTSGYDKLGYATQSKQDNLAVTSEGAFRFARSEDIDTNPANPMQLVMSSTGHVSNWPADSWGNVYLIDLSYDYSSGTLVPRATLTILYDGDDAGGGAFAAPDLGLRNPDGVLWADNGRIYVQEDPSHPDFGTASGEEASIFELDPVTGVLNRIVVMDRSVVVPTGSTDSAPLEIGAWESSGMIDVTDLFDTAPGEVLIIGDVLAHTISNGPIGGSGNLVGGGQLLLFSKPGQ